MIITKRKSIINIGLTFSDILLHYIHMNVFFKKRKKNMVMTDIHIALKVICYYNTNNI